MILDRCPKCRRPGREFCERYGRPCKRPRATPARKAPRYGDGQREALRRHWAEKAEIYAQEKAAYLARHAGKEIVPILAPRKPRKHVKSEELAARQREYEREKYAANRDEIRARRREQQRRKTEMREQRKASVRRYVA